MLQQMTSVMKYSLQEILHAQVVYMIWDLCIIQKIFKNVIKCDPNDMKGHKEMSTAVVTSTLH